MGANGEVREKRCEEERKIELDEKVEERKKNAVMIEEGEGMKRYI